MSDRRPSRSDDALLAIPRLDLIAITRGASAGAADGTRAKLLSVAEQTDRFTVGWWHCDGTDCPARQARVTNQGFQERFDRAMAARFGVDINDDPNRQTAFDPFVVEVTDER